MTDNSQHEKEETMDELNNSLHHHDPHASVQLARLILADRGDEGGSYHAFIRALTQQLRQWPGRLKTLREDDLVHMMRSAARELVREKWDS